MKPQDRPEPGETVGDIKRVYVGRGSSRRVEFRIVGTTHRFDSLAAAQAKRRELRTAWRGEST